MAKSINFSNHSFLRGVKFGKCRLDNFFFVLLKTEYQFMKNTEITGHIHSLEGQIYSRK